MKAWLVDVTNEAIAEDGGCQYVVIAPDMRSAVKKAETEEGGEGCSSAHYLQTITMLGAIGKADAEAIKGWERSE